MKLYDNYMSKHTVTEDNIDQVRETMAANDQAKELIIGCQTWGILHGSQRGQMTRWPNGRGAVCYGGDSVWGDWYGETLEIDYEGGCVGLDG